MTIFYLIIGLAGLWIASEIIIGGALEIAERYNISRAFIGLTVLAIGTDVPEVFVNISAAIQRLGGTETSDLVIGQTVGTSFGQAGLLLGFAGIMGVIALDRKKIKRDGLMLVLAAVLLFLLGTDGDYSRSDGILMIIVYLVYFGLLIREERVRERIHLRPKKGSMTQSILYIIGGGVLLAYASQMTVDNALLLTEQYGVTQSIVGALIIGLGTSLPEFATSAVAIRQGHGELAVGNLVGSTTFDMLFALGTAVVVSGLAVSHEILYYDILPLVALTLLVLLVLWTRSKHARREAIILVFAYLLYAAGKLGGFTLDTILAIPGVSQ